MTVSMRGATAKSGPERHRRANPQVATMRAEWLGDCVVSNRIVTKL